MDPQSLLAVEIGCWALAASFGVAGLALQVRDAFQTDAQRRATAHWYGGKWETIQRTGLLSLPEAVIEWLLRAKRRLPHVAARLRDILPDWSRCALFSLLIGASVVGPWMAFDRWWLGVPLGLASGPVLVALFREWARKRTVAISLAAPLSLLCIVAWLVGLTCLLKAFLTLSTTVATLVMLVVLPLFGLGLSFALWAGGAIAGNIRTNSVIDPEVGFVAGAATALSFLVTLCSLLIGHAVRPEAPVPQTLQMLFSNVVCDGLTMLATVLILGVAVGPQRKFPIPVAILLDLGLAVLLACASLWCGLVRTENALSVTQVARVLIGQSPAGTDFQLGPYFWAMHTTFLPTLLYLSLIALCWLAKLVVLPVALVLQKGRAVEKPHHASAVTLLLVAAIFAALAKGLAYLRSYATVPEP